MVLDSTRRELLSGFAVGIGLGLAGCVDNVWEPEDPDDAKVGSIHFTNNADSRHELTVQLTRGDESVLDTQLTIAEGESETLERTWACEAGDYELTVYRDETVDPTSKPLSGAVIYFPEYE